MSIVIKINGVDKSTYIEKDSVVFPQGVTKQPSILTFFIKKSSTKVMPTLGSEVILEEDGERVFKGTLTEKNESSVGGLMIGLTFTAKDGMHDFDRKLVKKAYNSTNAVAVAEDIVSSFTSGFTIDAPDMGPIVDSIRFNYEYPSQAMKALATETGWDWYIDPYDVVHFFPKGEKVAPFEVTDTNGKMVWGSLEFDTNIIDLKNIVYVRGGEYLETISAADAVDKYTADGFQLAWPLVFRYKNIQVTVDGFSKTVGIDNIDDPSSVDVLYNYTEKSVRFRDDNKPADGTLVKVFGDAYIPLVVQASDSVSVASYGEKEYIKTDKSVNSIAEAELLAGAILDQWSEGSYEGSFTTYEKGLRAGQMITINSAIYGVNSKFKINKIVGTVKGDKFEYKVSFIKSGETDFTQIMIDLLGRERKNIVISDDEVIQRLTQIQDTFEMTDEIVQIDTTSGPYKYAPGTNTAKWGFATWS